MIVNNAEALDTSQIRDWRSIVTLVVFILTNLAVLFPFHVPLYIPRSLCDAILHTLCALRLKSPGQRSSEPGSKPDEDRFFVRLRWEFPVNFVTAPLTADLFLIAILAIGRQEVHDGTLGADHISPISIMAFFLTLAYIAISIDASGLIRYLAFKVLQKGGKVGHKLFFYLYAFFFALGSFIGNDPIILSGTAFLAYMTRVSSNIKNPRAWIHSQFAVANIASAILVSSNPTNLVLAGAFNIKFIDYTANMIVPVIFTAVILFPFLLYIIFKDEELIPTKIDMEELSEEDKAKAPVNPNIPDARGVLAEETNASKILPLEEIMNPFLDKTGAAFGAFIMAAALIALLALNASSQSKGEHPVYWVTLPAAFIMFCWDLVFGWLHRHKTRQIARDGLKKIEEARAARTNRKGENTVTAAAPDHLKRDGQTDIELALFQSPEQTSSQNENRTRSGSGEGIGTTSSEDAGKDLSQSRELVTLEVLARRLYRWSQETFPTVTVVLTHLPWALVPFALCMFVLVQALVTKGWVAVFAYGWDHWVNKTGTIGAVAGMGFVSVILCNFAGTNIGTTILLSRVIQAWQTIHHENNPPITNRTFWATVYSMALGVNYGAFSIAFSAALAGLLWRDILSKKHIIVPGLQFARVNLPIIAISMFVGCIVLIGEVYIMRDNSPYNSKPIG